MSMLLHCGSQTATREEVFATSTPEATKTFQPINHSELITLIDNQIQMADLTIKEETFGLTEDGMRMFAMMMVETSDQEHATTIGVRNSNDKKFAAGLVVGQHTFVCDNLMFSGERKLARKHTNRIMEELPHMIEEFILDVPFVMESREKELKSLQNCRITDGDAHRLIIEMARKDVIANNRVVQVADEWEMAGSTCDKEEEFGEFMSHGSSLYRLQQAFTTVLGRNNTNIFSMPEKTITLNNSLLEVAKSQYHLPS